MTKKKLCEVKYCGIHGNKPLWWYWVLDGVPEFVEIAKVDKRPAKSAVLCCDGCKEIIEQNYWRAKEE